MSLFDVVPGDPINLRYRYFGTELTGYRRIRNLADPTGKLFDEADRAYDPRPMLDGYTKSIEVLAPVLMLGRYETERSIGVHERLVTPWRDNGSEINRLAVVVDRFPADPE